VSRWSYLRRQPSSRAQITNNWIEETGMGWKDTATRYGAATISMHWLTVLLLVAVYALMELKSFFPRGGEARATMAAWHFMGGLLVFVLVWCRLAVRAAGQSPLPQATDPAWQVSVAKAGHALLYAFMIGVPLLGWLTLSAGGKPIPFFGFELPALVAKDANLARTIKDLHESIATGGYFLIGGHAAAALFHHIVKKDATLQRMWFSR
jgi:cytochrome b561